MITYVLTISAIVLGLLGGLFLAFTGKKGHCSENKNTVVITDGDYYADPERKLKEIRNADWRHRNFKALGLGLIVFAALLQVAALAYTRSAPEVTPPATASDSIGGNNAEEIVTELKFNFRQCVDNAQQRLRVGWTHECQRSPTSRDRCNFETDFIPTEQGYRYKAFLVEKEDCYMLHRRAGSRDQTRQRIARIESCMANARDNLKRGWVHDCQANQNIQCDFDVDFFPYSEGLRYRAFLREKEDCYRSEEIGDSAK